MAASFFKIATPWGRLRSSTSPRLLRFTARNGAETPGACSRSMRRVASPEDIYPVFHELFSASDKAA